MLFYFILIFCEYLTNSLATRCFSCKHVANLTDCMTVKTCSSNEQCFTEQVVTNTAQIMFNTGCVLKSHCAVKRETGLRKRDDTDIVTCLECCAGDFCNDRGCGVQASNQRGLYCFNCDSAANASDCNNIKKCEQDELCLLYTSVGDDITFHSQCRSQVICDALSHTFVNVHCPANCCSRDFCNDQCGKVSSQVSTSTAAPLTTTANADGHFNEWSTWSTCTVTCGGGIQSRQRTCVFPPNAPIGRNCTGLWNESKGCSTFSCEPITPSTIGLTTMPIVTEPIPLTARSCFQCLGPTNLCEKLNAPMECPLEKQYCINTLDNKEDATRVVEMRCGTRQECESGWFTKYSSNDRCTRFDQNFVYTNRLHCEFCCADDDCNAQINPDNKWKP